jgi:ABC-type transport system involved in cytochrome c biogenesis ATPase subunit
MSADRQVTQAVNEVLALAPRRGEVSLARLVAAVEAHRAAGGLVMAATHQPLALQDIAALTL